MEGVDALYLYVLAGIAGYVLIARVPSVLHLSLLSGANFVHGVVLCGALLALARADTGVERVIGTVAVALAAANVVGGYLVTDRLLTLFERRRARSGKGRPESERSRGSGPVAGGGAARSADRGAGDRPGDVRPGERRADARGGGARGTDRTARFERDGADGRDGRREPPGGRGEG